MPEPDPAHVLDNAAWNALSGRQSHLAEVDPSGRARRFTPEVAIFCAVERLDDAAWQAQGDLVGAGGVTILFRDEVPTPPRGWTELFRYPTWQLVAGELASVSIDASIEPLGPADGKAMLDLARLTESAPFADDTPTLGTYLGIRTDGRLAAMAGERLRPPGFTEISAVSTHPDCRKRGYGAALTLAVAQQIRDRGDEAFLHVLASNENALRLYEAIGFCRRRLVEVVGARRETPGEACDGDD